MDEENKKSLRDSVRDLEGKLETILPREKKDDFKRFRLPFRARIGRRKRRKNWCVVCYIGSNKQVKFVKVPIRENVIEIDGVPHWVTPEYILNYKNKTPIIILPSWSEKPFDAGQHSKETMANQEGSMGWQFIVNYLLNQRIIERKKFGIGAIIIGTLVVLGIGYYAFKSGAFS